MSFSFIHDSVAPGIVPCTTGAYTNEVLPPSTVYIIHGIDLLFAFFGCIRPRSDVKYIKSDNALFVTCLTDFCFTDNKAGIHLVPRRRTTYKMQPYRQGENM